MKKTLRAVTILMLLSLGAFGEARAEIIFQDNFDDHSDWSPDQPIYPNTQGGGKTDGAVDGSTRCTGCPNGKAKWSGFFIASSSWSGYKGNNTLNIGAANARGGTGKALTVWMEPIDTTKCDGGTYWCSDGQLAVSLPSSYPELYISWYTKFQSDWAWRADTYPGAVTSSTEKFLHVSHHNYTAGVGYFQFFSSGNHFPLFIFNLGVNGYYGQPPVAQADLSPRFQSTYYGHLATPPATYLGGQYYEKTYFGAGGSKHGEKTWQESIGDGEWHRIVVHLKGNSAKGAEDGMYELWIDDYKVLTRNNVAWADSVYDPSCPRCVNPPADFRGWNWVSIGGNMYNRKYSESQQIEQWYAIDDFMVSTEFVPELKIDKIIVK